MYTRILKIVLIYFFIGREVKAWRGYSIVIEDVKSDYDDNYINITSNLATENDKTYLTIYGSSFQTFDMVHASFFVQLFSNLELKTDLILMNKTINICKFLSNRGSEPILRRAYDEVTKFGYLPRVCPIRKDTYFINKLSINEESFPVYMPNANFLAQIKLTVEEANDKRQILDFKITGVIDSTKALDKLKKFAESGVGL